MVLATRQHENVLGLGSVSSEDSDKMTLKMESAGLQAFFRISRQMWPVWEMFIWYILEWSLG